MSTSYYWDDGSPFTTLIPLLSPAFIDENKPIGVDQSRNHGLPKGNEIQPNFSLFVGPYISSVESRGNLKLESLGYFKSNQTRVYKVNFWKFFRYKGESPDGKKLYRPDALYTIISNGYVWKMDPFTCKTVKNKKSVVTVSTCPLVMMESLSPRVVLYSEYCLYLVLKIQRM